MMKDLNDDSPLQNQINALIRSGYTAEEIFDKVSNTNEFKELSNIYGLGALDIYNNIYNEQSLSVDTANGIIDETAKTLEIFDALGTATVGGYSISKFATISGIVGQKTVYKVTEGALFSGVGNLLLQGYLMDGDLFKIDWTNVAASSIWGMYAPYSVTSGFTAYQQRAVVTENFANSINNARTTNSAVRATEKFQKSQNIGKDIGIATTTPIVIQEMHTPSLSEKFVKWLGLIPEPSESGTNNKPCVRNEKLCQ
jgi:hypothetical protein